MKIFRMVILGLVAVSVISILGVTMKQSRQDKETRAQIQELWEKAEQARKDGLPQTAAGHFKEITGLALKIGEKGMALTALIQKLAMESVVEGNRPEERIVRLKKEMALLPADLLPVMKLVLARWYWHYFQRNRWRFLQRSATEGLDEEDFTAWDLPRLFREIASLYDDVLEADAYLKSKQLSEFADFFQPGNQPPALRPTLFDFAAWEGLEFYTSAEQAAAKPEDAFEILSESAALSPADTFLAFRPETTDVDSPKLKALCIFQALLEFHRSDLRPDAFLHADLGRLRWVRNVAVGENVSELYLLRLKELAERHPGSEIFGEACHLRAKELFDRDERVAALDIASRGEKAYPHSVGGRNCRVLKARILAREFELRTESVILPGRVSHLVVSYRNVTRLNMRVVRRDFEKLFEGGGEGLSYSGLSEDALKILLARAPTAEWTVELAPTEDFRTREAVIEIPALDPGYYQLVAGLDPKFSFDGNKIETASFWASRLGLVLNARDRESVSGTVVNSGGGEPRPGVEVSLCDWQYNRRVYEERSQVISDDAGHFELIKPARYAQFLVVVRDKDGDAVASSNIPYGVRREPQVGERTVLFTDRALYRPGQTIHFKGICLSLDQGQNIYRTLPGRTVTVGLRDVNGETVSDLELRTNDYGSFSGMFVAPADRLTGEMTIVCREPDGQAVVRVEEYKRPKFQVQVDIPDKEFRLDDEVEAGGAAAAYTGAPIDDALVRFRVVREVNVPYWWFYRHGAGTWRKSQEIAHGTVRTDDEGKFLIRFRARSDPSVPRESQPVFDYMVRVDVTDGSGETRSAQGRVRIGAVSLQAGMDIAEWQESGRPVEVKISTANLNGRPAAAEGRVEIFSLRGPEKPVPADLIGEVAVREREALDAGEPGFAGTSDWRKWPAATLVDCRDFRTADDEDASSFLSFDLPPGAYQARLTTRDRYGSKVEAVGFFIVLAPSERRFGVPVPFHVVSRSDRAEVGRTYELLWATGYDQGPLLIEVLRDGRRLQRFWTDGGQTQGRLRVPVDSSLKGGFTVVCTLVKENRFYRSENRVSVPWSDKALDLRWTSFRSKLLPGQKERWALEILGPQALPAAAELVAAMYDASLDQFFPHAFSSLAGIFARDLTFVHSLYSNRALSFSSYGRGVNDIPPEVRPTYPAFPEAVGRDLFGFEYYDAGFAVKAPAPLSATREMLAEEKMVAAEATEAEAEEPELATEVPPAPDLTQVPTRRNLDETAFFFPHLLTDKEGTVSLEFTMPEALTEWRFLGLAHTRDLASGSLEGRTVTQKDLMVQPNPPRFLREGDALEFTVKVTNMTAEEIRGGAALNFSDPVSEKPLDAELGNLEARKEFAVPPQQSRTLAWAIRVPDGLQVAAFKAVAATDRHSDGEEGWLPVLSRRLFVRESLPLWISGRGRKTFVFDKLARSAESTTLAHHSLTVQMASHPAWYAVQALPYLMEFPYECSEQVFNRLYANSLARHIALSDPKIRRVFDLWKGTEALDSNLEKNEDLKGVLLRETPWVLEARSESEARRRVGMLFDANRLDSEIKSAYGKLADMMEEGSWPWFPGGRSNRYISLYIITGFGRLRNMGVASAPLDLALAALDGVDEWMEERYRDLVRRKALEDVNIDPTTALYLYGRSFFLKDKPVPPKTREAVAYFLEQAKTHWLKLGSRQSQGHLALGLKRFGFPEEAGKIMRSIKERSRTDEEMGRSWSEGESAWWWYEAPIETQALMIEAFDEVMNDAPAVEECKVWLLKQKQTQAWKTTKATADAVYALLLRGESLLSSDALVEIRLGGLKVEPETVEAGTGFYQKRFAGPDVRPAMAEVTLDKTDPGIAWGGLHWQYFEDIGAVTPHVQNPLRLKKQVFVRRLTKKGPVIEPVPGALEVGDTLVVRIELRSDRDLEYVHMKDHRGSGIEPVNVLSRYKHQDGLWYYESTKDAATHFFIDVLPKGTYVFEYSQRVVHRGTYENGLAFVECMYAPEFNSHSESVLLEVK
ncbi:MAG: hypothetical protein JW747_02230 [Candidatus Aminicenantes bacterium]|nr:hypothetical protein [Candidatus Aminicenantes bacterium]